MKNIAWITVILLAAAGCRQDHSALERKVDKLSAQIAALDQKLGGAARPQRPRRPEPAPKDVYAVPIANLPAVGPADAPVTIVEGYEYACPACNSARQSVAMTRAKYGDKVRVVYKPFIVHPDQATDASLAVCAANQQGKFAEMDQLVWDKGFAARDLSAAKLEALAAEAGLDLARYKQDLGPCRESVMRDHAELQRFGQGATPTFYINGRYVVGASPVALHAVIDEELALADQRIEAGTPPADYYKTWVLGKGLQKFEPRSGS